MKKLWIVGLLVLLAGNQQSHAQGTINFVNSSSELVTILVTEFGATLANADSATYGTRIQLFYQPGSVAQPSAITAASGLGNWVAIGGVGTNVTTGGRFSVGTVTTGSDVQGGGTVWLQAVAWTGAAHSSSVVYNSYSAAVSDGSVIFGTSAVWEQVTGNPNGVPPTVPVNASINGLTGILIWPGPEPSTISLFGLGTASMLFFRKRK